jgi:Zn-dependent protease
MIFDLFSSPLLFLVWLVAIIIGLSVHEFSHALAGYLLGDHTAKEHGRLTLNPLSHVSGMGFLLLMFAGFGWGKPVPFNPLNLKYKRFGPALVAIAGPLSNLILAVFSGVVLKILIFYKVFPLENLLIQFLFIFIMLNMVLMIFNLIPLPPLDGSKVLFGILAAPKYHHIVFFLEKNGPFLLILLLVLDNFVGINIFGGLFNFIINFVNNILV